VRERENRQKLTFLERFFFLPIKDILEDFTKPMSCFKSVSCISSNSFAESVCETDKTHNVVHWAKKNKANWLAGGYLTGRLAAGLVKTDKNLT
jgi:hypothetical protein